MFSTADLANMKSCQSNHCMDECKIQARVQTKNDMNEQVESWPVDGAAIVCGFDPRPGSERHGNDKTIVNYDATLRMPYASVPTPTARIKITKRHDVAEGVPIVYDIVSPIQKGPSGIRIMLKKIET